MPPKDKDKNKSKPEKCAELKEGWAEHLPLKYDDKTYGDRFGSQFFVENFNSSVLENSSDLDDDILGKVIAGKVICKLWKSYCWF